MKNSLEDDTFEIKEKLKTQQDEFRRKNIRVESVKEEKKKFRHLEQPVARNFHGGRLLKKTFRKIQHDKIGTYDIHVKRVHC